MRIRHLNAIIQIHVVFHILGIGLKVISSNSYVDDEEDEEVVLPLD